MSKIVKDSQVGQGQDLVRYDGVAVVVVDVVIDVMWEIFVVATPVCNDHHNDHHAP